MTPALNSILIIVAAVSLLGALYFLLVAIRTRGDIPSNSYGVERQEARHIVLASYVRSGFFFCLALIFLAILGIGNYQGPNNPDNDSLAHPAISTSTVKAVTTQTATSPANGVGSPSPTSPVPTFTATASPTPIPTDTPTIIVARVNSPNGLWLREQPGGAQELELIGDGSELLVLEGTEVIDDLEWQLVRTQTGLEGWVAKAYIELQ